MAILCDFKPVGIEGMSLWRVAASCSNERRWFGASKSQVLSSLLNQQLPQQL